MPITLTAGWNTLTASTADFPVCLYPNTRSIQWGKFSLTKSDSRACLCRRIKRRESPPDQGGSWTWWTRCPLCRTPKLKPVGINIVLVFRINIYYIENLTVTSTEILAEKQYEIKTLYTY